MTDISQSEGPPKPNKPVTRLEFIKLSIGTGLALFTASCGGKSSPPEVVPSSESSIDYAPTPNPYLQKTAVALQENPVELAKKVEALSDAIKNRAVKIIIEAPSGGTRIDTSVGSGTIFYENENYLVLLTAGHLLKDPGFDLPSCNVLVQRFHWAPEYYEYNKTYDKDKIRGRWHDDPDIDVGLVFIEKEKPKLFSENGQGLVAASPAVKNQHVQMLTYPIGLSTTYIPYNDMEIKSVTEKEILVDAKDNPSQVGASGAGVFLGDSLIGVHKGASNKNLKIIPINVAANWIADTMREQLNLGQ